MSAIGKSISRISRCALLDPFDTEGAMIGEGKVPAGQTAALLVAKAIYGRTEEDVLEMAGP